jgi:hypothetical protein
MSEVREDRIFHWLDEIKLSKCLFPNMMAQRCFHESRSPIRSDEQPLFGDRSFARRAPDAKGCLG